MQIGNYVVVVRSSGKKAAKPKVIQILDRQGKVCQGIVQSSVMHLTPEFVQANIDDVVLDLGDNPYPGTVYGVDLRSRYIGTRNVHKSFPPFHVFTVPSEENRDSLKVALADVSSVMAKIGLKDMLYADTCFEIRPKMGRYSGRFMLSSNLGTLPDRIELTIDDNTKKLDKSSGYRYVMLHELGHKLHLRYLHPRLKPKLNSEWLALYRSSISQNTITEEYLSGVLSMLLELRNLSIFVRSLSPSERKKFQHVIDTIRLSHKLKPDALDIMVEDGSEKALRSVWPTEKMMRARPVPILTQYATENFKELFAEAFAYFMLGRFLIPEVQQLMETSVKSALRG